MASLTQLALEYAWWCAAGTSRPGFLSEPWSSAHIETIRHDLMQAGVMTPGLSRALTEEWMKVVA